MYENKRWNWIAVASLSLFTCVALAQSNLKIEGLPGPLVFHNKPTSYRIDHAQVFSISSGPKSDWFVDPFDGAIANSAPMLKFTPANTFVFQAKVTVSFQAKWDAGALMLWADDHHWAKLSLELSPQKKPTIVTVVTRGLSDDCNSITVEGNAVYLQIAKTGSTYVFYYSTDGSSWNIVRTFNLDTTSPVSLGLESQSPDGNGSTAVFSRMLYSEHKIANVYTGK